MAAGFSNNELNYARKKYYGKFHVFGDNTNIFQKLINFSLTRLYFTKYTILNIKRKILRVIDLVFFFKKKENSRFDFDFSLNDEAISKISNELKENEFTYIENFLSEESYNLLLNTWPNINHFDHIKKIIKHYNASFKYNHDHNHLKKTFQNYPQEFGLKKFYKFLLSDKSQNFYEKIFKINNEKYFVPTIISTMASNNSYLIPHYDGIAKNKKIKRAFNFIYFLDGYEENLSLRGATGIYKDNEFKFPILLPKTIKNSVLIYNTLSSNFYHGFKNIDCPKNVYRKTINFQVEQEN